MSLRAVRLPLHRTRGRIALSTVTPPDSSDPDAPAQRLPEADLLPRGATLARYIVVAHRGTGGQGVVYEAYDPALGRRVALKLLRPDAAASSGPQLRLLKEAQGHAQVQHANVVPIHDVGTFLGQPYFAMSYLPGGTLREWLATPRAPEDILARFLEAGRGLSAAHTRGIIHRDFKPDNVLLDEHGVAHVADFGLALSGPGQGMAGTARYKAPEQHVGGPVTAASDQFAFCVALCEALTGQLPVADGPGAPFKLPTHKALAPWLRRALTRGLSRAPQDRFLSMESLLAELESGPGQRRRLLLRVGLPAVMTALLFTVAALLSRESPEERARRLCLEAAKENQARLWTPQRVATMESGFQKTTGAGDTWARVRGILEPEVAALGKAREGACLVPVSTAHERCLEARGRVLQGLTDLFVQGHPEVLSGALNAVLIEVSPVAGCLTSTVASPRVVPDSEADQRLRPTLAQARVLRAAGQYSQAMGAALDVVAQANAARAVRVEAEAQLMAGVLQAELRRPEAEQSLQRAAMLAEQASADEERARAWLALSSLYAVGDGADDAERATLAREQADAILERLGRPDHLEAQYQYEVAQLARLQGDREAAAAAFARELELRRRYFDDAHPVVMRARTNWALSLPADRALPQLESVLADRERAFGPRHPETAVALRNVAAVLLEVDCDRALVPAQRALDIRKAQQPLDARRLAAEHFMVARAHECLARAEPPGDAAQRRFAHARGAARDGLEALLSDEAAVSDGKELREQLRWTKELLAREGAPEPAKRKIDDVIQRLDGRQELPRALPEL